MRERAFHHAKVAAEVGWGAAKISVRRDGARRESARNCRGIVVIRSDMEKFKKNAWRDEKLIGIRIKIDDIHGGLANS